jgi:tetratricopeptide (TPR) repeat protein
MIKMKQILIFMMVSLTYSSYGQEQMTYKKWIEEAKTNIRLSPKYGHQQKTDEQKEIDQQFINETIQNEKFKGDRTAASNYMISLGFKYLSRADIKTAMYRFNQAYLLDSLNTDIYWGFGAVYFNLGDYEKAKLQCKEGLTLKPTNTHLLTDLGSYHMTQYNFLPSVEKKNGLLHLDSAISYMKNSYKLDPQDQNTLFKLSACSYLKSDCANAWKYYNECKILGGAPITEQYTAELKKKCKRNE